MISVGPPEHVTVLLGHVLIWACTGWTRYAVLLTSCVLGFIIMTYLEVKTKVFLRCITLWVQYRVLGMVLMSINDVLLQDDYAHGVM